MKVVSYAIGSPPSLDPTSVSAGVTTAGSAISSVRAGISLGASVVIVESPLNSPDSERSCRLASRQSESSSPGSANLQRCSEMK